MSVFTTTETACPACQAAVKFELVHSVNAARRPDLRAAILARNFQRQDCPACGTSFRLEPLFSYLDITRKQYLAVWPAARLGQWKEDEARAQASYDAAFGRGSDGAPLAPGMLARCVFGWAGLNEKIIAAEHGIDDVALEVAKVAVMRELGELKLSADREFRLVGATDDELIVGWLRTSTEDLDEELSVPRELLKDIADQPVAWAALRATLSAGMFVDYRRTLFG